jgi:ribosome-binding factor A
VVKILAFLDLEQISEDFEIEHFETASPESKIMKAFARSDRVSGLIQQVLSEILQKGINDPRLKMTTITNVKMSRDLRVARIYFAISGGQQSVEEVVRGFESARGFVKRSLASKLGLRYMPELKFFYDDSFDYGAHINKILKSIETDNGPDNKSDNKSTVKQ